MILREVNFNKVKVGEFYLFWNRWTDSWIIGKVDRIFDVDEFIIKPYSIDYHIEDSSYTRGIGNQSFITENMGDEIYKLPKEIIEVE